MCIWVQGPQRLGESDPPGAEVTSGRESPDAASEVKHPLEEPYMFLTMELPL